MGIASLTERFRYHPAATPGRAEQHNDVRASLLRVAQDLNDVVPEGREKALMLTKLEEAMFWANAAVARQGD